ncbi:Kynurenine formamidase [Oscillibacter sp. PC13]|uniref:cyclase family protein n=1 Tax=Oscillibacter sp. PC13 TaxID=1855299 RepID=UPI0008EC63E1|nr:cyclase family protein [Oscillibacter sp. PC13]SFP50816.1 Kynurenine formamidase [Oscillibacter sp. PC13]
MIIDLTHTITPETFVYPGTPAPSFSVTRSITRDGARETLLQVGSHTGTHMDAPRHILPDGFGLDQLPASQFCGRAAVINVSHLAPGSVITADFLREQNGYLRSADFALFYTGWEKKWDTPAFLDDPFPILDAEAAQYLVCCGLKGVGTDAISVDALSDAGFTAHHVLLNGGLVIVENLCLKKLVGRRDIMFFALPLKFEDADGAPVRAIAEFRDFPEPEEKEMLEK